jgi:hypothetical protein
MKKTWKREDCSSLLKTFGGVQAKAPGLNKKPLYHRNGKEKVETVQKSVGRVAISS